MIMNKIKKKPLKFPESVERSAVIDFYEEKIEVKRFLSDDDEQTLIPVYVETYFDNRAFGNSTDFNGAERLLDFAILDTMTSIDASLKKWYVKDKNKILDYVYETGLMDKIKSHIVNYGEMYKKIQRIVADGRQERFSARGLFKEAIESISELDFEKLKNFANQIKELQEEMKDSPLRPLLDESKKG